jgi:hypothetical protein
MARTINPSGPDSPWFAITGWNTDDSLEWTPRAPATYELEIRMRSTGGSDAAEAITESVKLQAVPSLTGPALNCGSPGILFVQVPPNTGLVAVQPNILFDCHQPLEYKILARRAVAGVAWSTLHDWSPERVFYWRQAQTPTEFQILYRRQGSNLPFEGTTTTAIVRRKTHNP